MSNHFALEVVELDTNLYQDTLPGFLCTDGAGAWLGGEGGMPIVKKWEIKLSGRP